MVRHPRRLAGHATWLLVSLVVLLSSIIYPNLGHATTSHTLVPIGGGYTTATLQTFARTVIEHARPPDGVVHLYIVPSAYGDDPADRKENIELAQGRTGQVEAACDSVVHEYKGFSDCQAILLLLFDRIDAENPANSAVLTQPGADGVFILGGDQEIAMRVLVNTPAEANLRTAYDDGVVVGGTSAGAAVESRTMFWYTQAGWPYNALEKPMIEVWWYDGLNDDTRGLIFGSDKILIDQHFYERGRLTRLLNVVAQSEEYYGTSKLGVGVDWGTGARLGNDAVLSGVFGETSVSIVDGETLRAEMKFVGRRQTLSARNLLTHVVAQHPLNQVWYNVDSRLPHVKGVRLAGIGNGWDAGVLSLPAWANATLVLGGDVSRDWDGSVMTEFVNRAMITGSTRVVVVAAGYRNAGQAQSAAEEYAKGLREAGWDRPGYTIDTFSYDPDTTGGLPDPTTLQGAAAVLFVGGDQSLMAPAIADPRFTSLVTSALRNVPLVMTDSAMTAVMGSIYVTNPDPTDSNYQDEAIRAYKTGYVTLAKGLGIVSGAAFEPLLTLDQRWGRLYSLAQADQKTIVFGISEITAILVDDSGATVTGERSVAALDARSATFLDGDNGAFSAFNVVMDIFAPGETVRSER